jgi:hypothetical protein
VSKRRRLEGPVADRNATQGPSAHVREFVARIRRARARVGHELTQMQEAIAASIAAHDPRFVPASQRRLEEIRAIISQKGEWIEWDEWRISTSFESRIAKTEQGGKDWYQASVECDGQRLACGCPTLGQAYAFLRLYQQLIIEQFYSVGPPWADNRLYEA